MHNFNEKKISELVDKISIKDSEKALKELYTYYFEKLARFVLLYAKSEESTEEIISDTFLIIWQNRKKLPEIKNFNSYIYKIARNKAISYYRTVNMHYETINDTIPIDLYYNTYTTPEEEMIEKEMIEKLDRTINSLPTQCKIVYKLIREDQMKYKEAADVLNISVKTLEAHMTRAIKELRKTLNSTI